MATRRELSLDALSEEFQRWEDLLAGISVAEITSSRLRNGWSIKDLMAHLMSWQQVSNARLEAAIEGGSPGLPEWLAGSNPETEEEIHDFNARIFDNQRDRPWEQIYEDWRSGFLRVMKLGSEIPEHHLLEPGRYAWLNGQPLVAVLEGTYHHHHVDHLGYLLEWLDARPG